MISVNDTKQVKMDYLETDSDFHCSEVLCLNTQGLSSTPWWLEAGSGTGVPDFNPGSTI